jgi:hypothetical protein
MLGLQARIRKTNHKGAEGKKGMEYLDFSLLPSFLLRLFRLGG